MLIDIYFLLQKDSNAVKEALDQLNEIGWAKRWSSQPYVSRRMVSLHYKYAILGSGAQNISHIYKTMHTCISVRCFEFFIISYFARLNSLTILKFMHQTSLRELTTLGMKNAENLAIPSVRNDVSTFNTRILVVSITWGERNDLYTTTFFYNFLVGNLF